VPRLYDNARQEGLSKRVSTTLSVGREFGKSRAKGLGPSVQAANWHQFALRMCNYSHNPQADYSI
ncbi:MAG: hypothetical protein AAFR23_03880, partial [Pseudomonadota bacterium]